MYWILSIIPFTISCVCVCVLSQTTFFYHLAPQFGWFSFFAILFLLWCVSCFIRTLCRVHFPLKPLYRIYRYVIVHFFSSTFCQLFVENVSLLPAITCLLHISLSAFSVIYLVLHRNTNKATNCEKKISPKRPVSYLLLKAITMNCMIDKCNMSQRIKFQ